MTNHEQIVAAYETYIAENEKFTAKGVSKPRLLEHVKPLQEMSKGIKERRKEITAEKRSTCGSTQVTPSLRCMNYIRGPCISLLTYGNNCWMTNCVEP
jgi:hypothetical protein